MYKNIKNSHSSIELIIHAKEHDLGGFSVRRTLPYARKRMVGPWIFFDHIGPATFAPGSSIDVRPHPHINLATVTYLFRGELLHRDSLGNEVMIKPGEINLMVAGKGIVHSERQRPEIKAHAHALEGLQLWLALPEADEEIEPEFHHYDAKDIPQIHIEGVAVRLLIGSCFDLASPVRTFADTLYLDVRMQTGQRLQLPTDVEELAIYVVDGELSSIQGILPKYTLSVINTTNAIYLDAVRDTQLVVIGGGRLSKRYMWWNFVSSRRQRIEQAKLDWKTGTFPKIPGDDIEFIPLPEE